MLMRFFTWTLCGLLALTLASCGDTQGPSTVRVADDEPAPMGQLSRDVLPLAYRLNIEIDPDAKRFSGIVEIDLAVGKPKAAIYLHGKGLTVTKAEVEAAKGHTQIAQWAQVTPTGVAKVSFPDGLDAGEAKLRISYDAPFSETPDTLWSAKDNGLSYAATQFQALGARKAFPSFDEPAFKAPFTITIRARENHVTVSNAAIAKEVADGAGWKRVTFKATEPLPTYLVAMMVGPYDVLDGPAIPPSALRTEPIPLRGITVKGKSEGMRFALSQTGAMMTYLEDYFATPYPYGKLDLIAPPNFAAGGMENAGAITYSERVILLDENASAQQKARFFLVHAHELAHLWFGDYVTPEWWDDLWLNESFATWMEAKVAEKVRPGQAYDRVTVRDGIRVMDLDSLKSARSVRQPVKSDGDIFNAFDGLTYSKGAAILKMFEGFAGEDAFRKGIRLHMQRFPHGTATAKDFLNSIRDGTGNDKLVAAFESFLTQPGVPFLRTQMTCDGTVAKGEIAQGAYTPLGAETVQRFWKVPVCLRNMNRNEPQQCALIEAQAAQVAMLDVCPAPAVMMNAGGQGYYRFDVTPEGWTNMLAKADTFSPAEQLVFVDSLRAAFNAGLIDAKLYWAGLERFALSPAHDVVTRVGEAFLEMRDKLVAKNDRAAFEKRIEALYALEWAMLKPPAAPSDDNAQSRRNAIAMAMVRTARSKPVITALSPLLAAMTGPKSDDPQPADRTLLPAIAWSAVSGGTPDLVKALLKTITDSTDMELRGVLMAALPAAGSGQSFEAVADFALNGPIRLRERTDLIRAMFEDGDMQVLAWPWLKANFDSLAAKFTEGGRNNLIRVTRNLCDSALKTELESFYQPKLEKIPGSARELANAMEFLGRCLALKDKKMGEVSAIVIGR